ncbi:MAG: glycosyltransferase family 4 protein [Anaerolineales bacterium]|nr:glycosyltransferase family 4 protein [Anaerolineales bacterium]
MPSSQRIRVLHLLKAVGIAGAESHLLALLPALLSFAVDPSVILLEDPRRPQDALRARWEAAGISVFTLPIRGHIDPSLPARLGGLLRREPFDILHAHLPHGEVYGEIAMRAFPARPFVVSRHNDDRFRRWLPLRPVFAPSLRRAGRIIAISQAVRRFLVETEGAPAQKIEVVPYGIDADSFARSAHPGKFRREIGAGGESIVGFVGRLTRQKGVDILLRAFASVERELPAARLVLAGDGPDRPALERLAHSLGLRRARFLGWRDDAADVMAGADLLAIPSRWEGFGLVALEAMALGKPVVAADVSALPEIVVPEETGLLVSPGDPAGLAESIRALAADRPRAERMGRAGSERVRKEFPVEKMAERTVKAYRKIVIAS